jgi:hypothetical protein
MITALATLTPMDQQTALQIDGNVSQNVEALKANDTLLQDIFGNNFFLTMLMFIPFLGPVVGGIIFYNTGVVLEGRLIAANVNQHMNFPPLLGFFSQFILPVIWLEFIAYSTAMAGSIWLSIRLVNGNFRHELNNTAKFISLCAVILLVSAIIETVLINSGL